MKFLRFYSLCILILIASKTLAFADVLQIGDPTYSGTGCEAGSATLSLSPDRSQLSVLFSNFVAESGARLGRQMDRKGCVLSLPIHIPAGFTVAIATVDYRGFMNLPAKTRGQFVASSTFAGAEKFRENRPFKGPFMDTFTFRSQATSNEKIWSQCGRDTVLRTHAALLVNSGPSGEEAMGAVDSIDVAAGISYRFELKPCKDPTPVPTVPVDPYPSLGELSANMELGQGQGVRSRSGQFLFVHQTDGNVVLYGPQGAAWSSQTFGLPSGKLVMQGDGNLVVYDISGNPIWNSATDGHPGARLAIQDDGNLVIYDVNNAPLW